MRLAVFGSGGMGRETMDVALRSQRVRSRYTRFVFVTDGSEASVNGVDVIRPDGLKQDDELCFAIGDPQARKLLADRFLNCRFATIIAETAIVSPTAAIGPGSIVCEYAVINSDVVIVKHFIANVFSQVSHDCIIGDNVTFSPRVSCNGWVRIADEVFVGAGAVIRNGTPHRRLDIGKSATIGMGSLVLEDVPQLARVIGKQIERRHASEII